MSDSPSDPFTIAALRAELKNLSRQIEILNNRLVKLELAATRKVSEPAPSAAPLQPEPPVVVNPLPPPVPPAQEVRPKTPRESVKPWHLQEPTPPPAPPADRFSEALKNFLDAPAQAPIAGSEAIVPEAPAVSEAASEEQAPSAEHLSSAAPDPREPPISSEPEAAPVVTEVPPVVPSFEEVDSPIAAPTIAASTSIPPQPSEIKPQSPHRPPPIPVRLKPSPAPPKPAIDWEALIGGKWMTWVGAFVLLLALGFMVQWVYATYDAPPWMHVAAFHLVSAGLIGFGFYLSRKKLTIAAEAMTGLGSFAFYTSAYAALRYYHLWGEEFAFAEFSLITALSIGLALWYDSPGVILLGALGGYLTPILTSSGGGNYVGLFTYLAFLNVALVGCAVWRGWSFLKPLALAATGVMFALWILSSQFDPANSQMVWRLEWFGVLHGLIFLIGSTVPPLAWKRTSNPWDLLALSLGSLGFVGLTWHLFHDHPEQQLAFVGWGMAVLHGVLFGLTYARVSNVDRMPRIHLTLAAVFFTLAIPLQINNASYWGTTWAFEALVFMAIGVYFQDRQMRLSALVVAGIATIRLIGWDFLNRGALFGPPDEGLDVRYPMFMLAGVIMLVMSGLHVFIPWALGRERETDPQVYTHSGLLSMCGALLLILAQPMRFTGLFDLGLAWSLLGLAFMLLSFWVRDRQNSGTSLGLFALAGLWVGHSWLLKTISLKTRVDDPDRYAFLAFLVCGGLALLAGYLRRIRRHLTAGPPEIDNALNTHGRLIAAIGTLLITAAMPVQFADTPYLGLAWTVEALVFSLAGLYWQANDLRASGLLIAILATLRFVGWEIRTPEQPLANGLDLRYVAFMISGALMLLMSGMQRFVPRLLKRTDEPAEVTLLHRGALLGLSAAVFTLAQPLQFSNLLYLTMAWGTLGVAFTLLSIWLRDQQSQLTGLLMFVVAGAWLLYKQSGLEQVESQLPGGDNLGAFLACGGLAVFTSYLQQFVNRFSRAEAEPDKNALAISQILMGIGALLITLAMPIRYYHTPYLSSTWAIVAVAFTALGLWLNDRLPRVISLLVLGLTAVRLFAYDLQQGPLPADSGWDLWFFTIEFSALLGLLAGGLYLWLPKVLNREAPRSTLDLNIAAVIAGTANVVALLGLLHQWNGYVALSVWVVNVAILWGMSFRYRLVPLRWYALALAVVMVGGRAIWNGYTLPGEYQLLLNVRFISLALVAALYFGAGWCYRKLRERKEVHQTRIEQLDLNLDESKLDQWLGLLANGVLLSALTMEIHNYFTNAAAQTASAVPGMSQAELATYSIVWAIYAGVMVVFGFALRYSLFRYIGLAAFGLILLKVFFVDLATLRWMPRVLALAVLGGMLIGVSMLYQKLMAKTENAESPPDPPAE